MRKKPKRRDSNKNPAAPSHETLTLGLAPGTLLPSTSTELPRINCIKYNQNEMLTTNRLPFIVDALIDPKNTNQADVYVFWINIAAPNPEILTTLAEDFGIHPLVLEDIQNPLPRPKFEEFAQNLHVSLQRAVYEKHVLSRESVQLVCGRNYLITFFDETDPVCISIQNRLNQDQGKIRRRGSDYLLFTVLDECVDRFFPIIEALESHSEELEAEALQSADREVLEAILFLKHSVSDVRHSIWPLTEVVTSLQRSHSLFIHEEVRLYLRDISDHCLHLTDLVASLRDMTASILDLYRSSLTSNLNNVMKVLTIMSSIFIPLTFIAGLYGMNFEFMPELKLWWAYPLVLVGMATIAGGMLLFFRRKRWI